MHRWQRGRSDVPRAGVDPPPRTFPVRRIPSARCTGSLLLVLVVTLVVPPSGIVASQGTHGPPGNLSNITPGGAEAGARALSSPLSLRAVPTGGWSSLCSPCSPAQRDGAAMAYDPVDGYLVLYGGRNSSSMALLSDTWSYHAGVWTRLCNACGPGTREGADMVFDAHDGYVLMYGGSNGSALGDAWSFRGGGWTLLCRPCSPPARSEASMSYDPLAQEAVLFGGCGSTCPLDDTWTYAAGNWSLVCSSCGPGGRDLASMAFDPYDGVSVLFGGQGTAPLPWSDSWTFSGGTWTFLCSVCGPDGRSAGTVVDDSEDGVVLLFGGLNSSVGPPYLGDTWEFLAGGWHALTLAGAPAPRSGAAGADDPGDGYVVLAGGAGAAPYADAWGFDYGMGLSAPVAVPSVVEGGTTSSFTTTVSGGSGPFAYAWVGLPAGCTSANSDPLPCTPAPVVANSTAHLAAIVQDVNGALAPSPATNFTVLAPPTVALAATPPSGSLDELQNVSFTAAVAGGSGGYVFTWSGLPVGCATLNVRVLRCMPHGAPGNASYAVQVQVADSLGGTATSAPLAYVVDADPWVTPPTVTPTALELGTPVVLLTTAGNGSGGYTFSWSGLPPGCTSVNAPSLSCTPSSVAFNSTFLIRASVVDSNGFRATSAATLLAVTVDPSVGTPLGAPSPVDGGHLLNLSTRATGGAGGYTFRWWGLPTGCSSQDAPTIQCVPSPVAANTTSRIFVNVTDASGFVASSGLLFLFVDTVPVVVGPTASSTWLDAGQTTVLQVSVTGGTAGYAFRWAGLPPGCVGWNTPVLTCRPDPSLPQNTTFLLNVSVTDAAGVTVVSPALPLHVAAAVSVAVTSAGPTVLEGGGSTGWSARATGGDGNYSFSWWGLPPGCASANAPTLTCTPAAAGSNATYPVWVTVQDGRGAPATSAPVNLTVLGTLSVGPVTFSSADVDQREALSITASPSGGAGTYGYAWNGLPAGCTAVNLSRLDCRPSSNGTFTVEVDVSDPLGGHARSAPADLRVAPDPSVATFFASDASVPVGSSVTLSVVVEGGSAPFHYAFAGLPTGCSTVDTPKLSCTPTARGTYRTTVNVTDARGWMAAGSLTWSVTGGGGTSALLGLPSPYGYLLVGVAAALTLLALYVALPWLLASRAGRQGPGPAGPDEGTGEEGPGEPGAPAQDHAELVEEADLPEVREGSEPAPVGDGPVAAAGSAEPPPTEAGLPDFAREAAGGTGEPPAPPPGAITGPLGAGGGHALLVTSVEMHPGPGSPSEGPALPPPPSAGPEPAQGPEGAPAAPLKCPLCGAMLTSARFCRSCELDWSKLQIAGRTDTLRGRGPRP